ncbi:MAG TPA: prephenate dehydratase domain-containing protein [Candidatus Saccharimonadales bacterium]|nr:prephenate dehydratase domain-containing protein [Candidatus Saccharimonadales bacterium]
MIVAIQGCRGSYHDEAATQHFGTAYEPLSRETFLDVYSALAEGWADYAVAAQHNTIYGDIVRSQAALALYLEKFVIVGELSLPIHHCLLGLPTAELQYITSVHSQHEALMQCRVFLRQKLPQAAIKAEVDTAGSAQMVGAQNDPRLAAIASERAASLYGLQILAHGIEDRPHNITTFAILRRR